MPLLGQAQPAPLEDWQAYLWVIGGIILSVLIPWAILVLMPPASSQGLGTKLKWFWYISGRYLKQLAASLLLGLLIFAIAKSQGATITAWYQALLIGYAWDSTLQKFTQNR